jgi:hypothetical protein
MKGVLVYAGHMGLYDGNNAYGINVSIPAGRKGMCLCAMVSQCNYGEGYVTPSPATIRFGSSSGPVFTSRQSATIDRHVTNNPYLRARSELLTYDVPETSNGTVLLDIRFTAGPSSGDVFVYLLYGAKYGNSTQTSGTGNSTTLNSSLDLGGYVFGQVFHVDSTPSISEYNGVTIVNSKTYTSVGTSITMMEYLKAGSQYKTVNGGGTWGSSKSFIHTRVAFNALGKEYM